MTLNLTCTFSCICNCNLVTFHVPFPKKYSEWEQCHLQNVMLFLWNLCMVFVDTVLIEYIVYCFHPLYLVSVCVWMKPYMASLSFVLNLANTKGIHHRTSRKNSHWCHWILRSRHWERIFQKIFTFLNIEIKGLYAGFYLINKRSKQNILALCVFNDP